MTSRPYDHDQDHGFDAVLCDIDGVLRHWPCPGHGDLDGRYGLPAGTFAGVAFGAERLVPAITGEVTDEAWREGVAEELGGVCGAPEVARKCVAEWSAVVPRVDREVEALLVRAREAVPLALVSNATTRLEGDLAAHGLDGLAHAVVNTARIGVAKPDPRVYRLAAERVGVPVHRCLFVDDTLGNVVAAREVGMRGLHFRQVDDLRTALAPVLERS